MTERIAVRRPRSFILPSLLAGLLVGLMAEVSFHPFGTPFRFSLGPVTLSFAALFFSTLPSYLTGLTAGLMVPLVHATHALIVQPGMDVSQVLQAVRSYLPETLAYTLLGALLHLFRVPERTDKPITLALLLTLADVAVNVTEILVRGEPLRVLPSLPMMALVAVGRALVAGGAYYVLQEGVRARQWNEERRRHAEQLLFLSNLQTEAFYLQKSARDMEQVMAKAHRLYRELAGLPEQPLALEIATDIHEVKKDAQRTLSALFRMVKTPRVAPTMTFEQVVTLVLDANQTYAATLGKAILLEPELAIDFHTPRFGRWISILNNLVSNAVEACADRGTVTIGARRADDRLLLWVRDTGPGIPPEDWELIFSPGFTTKLDSATGFFSSGIGLTHVASLVRGMNGTIAIAESGPGGTLFRLEVPWDLLDVVGEEGSNHAAVSHTDHR